MTGRMILYRGSLKSCNYHCSYCPFSKRKMSEHELEKDKGQWERFCQSLGERAEIMGIRALMVVPYGEALIHPWYCEGMGEISTWSFIDAVGAQTNLSFPAAWLLDRFCQAGGRIEKLRLWATFHPEMTSVESFAGTCRELREAGVSLCAGAVGVPEQAGLIQKLRQSLPKEIYLWINRMDGLKRPYTKEERMAFQEVDPFFMREFFPVHGDVSRCEERLFIEGNGKMHTCNISQVMEQNWYKETETHFSQKDSGFLFPAPRCSRKLCSCYLAYGGRSDMMNHILFGPYPLFRIPRRARAVFLDIDGTLIPEGSDSVPEQTAECLAVLAKKEKALLFFATTLPLREAMERCKKIKHLFCGGIFAAGAYLRLDRGQKQEQFYFLESDILHTLEREKRKFRYRILAYNEGERIYKLTLLRCGHRPWSSREAKELFLHLPENKQKRLRYFIEGNCMQIVSAKASKANGVRELCRWIGIAPKDTVAVGNSHEDKEMMKITAVRRINKK